MEGPKGLGSTALPDFDTRCTLDPKPRLPLYAEINLASTASMGISCGGLHSCFQGALAEESEAPSGLRHKGRKFMKGTARIPYDASSEKASS